MKTTNAYLLTALCCAALSCAPSRPGTSTSDTLPATSLQPYGRTSINGQQLELISSAVHFGFSFEGEQCQVFASLPNGQGHNYLQYELDGVYQKRIRLTGDSKEPLVIAAPGAGKHTVWIYKATEAHTGAIAIEKVVGNNIKSLQKPQAPVIEFIGNSITCGAAADPSETPCGTGQYHDQHNAYMAYGPRVARALKTNFVLSSVSGIGIYRNWNSLGPTMPEVYEKVDFQATNPQRWNFSTVTPTVVSIALGTNDFSNGDGKKERLPFDSASFVGRYVEFVDLVKSKYPKVRIALLSSAMVNGKNRTTLQNCLTAVKQQADTRHPTDQPVALYFFHPMQARGCGGHPNVEDHAILAQELTPFFKKLVP
ncbi:GDSL-type esterase/lipase family protein [Hymenobacter tibetensis]|uniref:GDSL-type esterase/lipase family protein n=1 Tax=Hymenobacter tibetensis TaxID=497967 RepID=A0ABY4CRL8_9BACT|nr:SGNH/GDSL hydrolase family protein [Hymenobacter tibetensis]UOG72905.1 GDSL-type esterase/lipase family protein [Hymenobacter tibetensis]